MSKETKRCFKGRVAIDMVELRIGSECGGKYWDLELEQENLLVRAVVFQSEWHRNPWKACKNKLLLQIPYPVFPLPPHPEPNLLNLEWFLGICISS